MLSPARVKTDGLHRLWALSDEFLSHLERHVFPGGCFFAAVGWFSVSDEQQRLRFQERIDDPTKRWKLSPMDLESRSHYVDYSRAKDEMFVYTDLPESPWFVVEADDKRRARLNCIAHLLSRIPYRDRTDKHPPSFRAGSRRAATAALRSTRRRSSPTMPLVSKR